MAKIVDNPKRFKVIELSRNELAKIGGIGICDRCNGTSNTGYYVANSFRLNAITLNLLGLSTILAISVPGRYKDRKQKF